MSRSARQEPFAHSGIRIETQKVSSLSNESSNGTAEPVTPFDTDELTIDRLWKEVRSKGKVPDVKGVAEWDVDDEGRRFNENDAADERPLHTMKPLTRRRSLSYKDSKDGRSTLAILHLPGVQREDVHVSYQPDPRRLVISYKSVVEIEQWEEDKVTQETTEKRCVRAVTLPLTVRPDQVRASMSERKLYISFPKQ